MSLLEELNAALSQGQPTSQVSLLDDLNSVLGEPTQTALMTQPLPEAEEPRGILGEIIDVLSRGNYASAKFFDTILSKDPANPSSFPSVLGSALVGAAQEAWNPQSRLTFADVIRRNANVNEESGWTTAAIEGAGLIGDIALDPLTWLTFGYGATTKLGKAGQLLSKAGKAALKSEILSGATREVAEDIISKAISSGRSDYLAKFKLFGVPVAKQGAIENAVETMYKASGLPTAAEFAKNVKWDFLGERKGIPIAKQAVEFAEWLPKAFNYKAGLPEEYLDARRGLIADWAKGAEAVKSGLRKLFTDFKDEEIDAVEKVHQNIYDKTREAYEGYIKEAKDMIAGPKAAGAIAPEEIKSFVEAHALNEIRKESPNIWEREFIASRLDPKLKVLSASMRQEYMAMGKRLQEAGLVKGLVENYHPLVFDLINDKTRLREFIDYTKNPYLPAGEIRKLRTFEAARKWMAEQQAKGFPIDLETDAMKLYAMRALQAEKALAYENFKSQLKIKGFDFEKLPKRIAEDIKFLGEGDYAAGMSDAIRTGLKWWDASLGAFRKLATTLKPAFAGKQAVSNSIQAYLELGPKAFRFFDPRSRIDAFSIMAHQSGYGDEAKFLSRKMVNALGEQITGADMMKEIADNNVVRGTNIGSGGIERTARDLMREIDRERWTRRLVGKEYDGAAKLFKGAMNYTAWPSVIEDFSRVNLYVNARRAGMSAKEAAKKVDDALFDYVHGLSQFERRWVRRIVPFYSFQRFIVPMLGETLLKEPGRLANVAKTSRDFMEVYGKLEGGEDLTPSERAVLPGWLLDQPFAKFDTDRQAMFRVLSNFNPLDVMGMVEVDQGGDIDVRKSLVNASLSQLAPLLKMPFEVLANRNFFTDRAIAGEKSSGRIGDVSASGVFSNILAAIGGNIAGLPGVAAGKGLGEILPDEAAQWLMNATGWERVYDAKTKKYQTYINPYLAYVATSQFPILSQAIRFDRYNEADHPWERWLDLVGVPTTRVNLKDSYRYGKKGEQYELAKAKAEMRTALAQGRKDKYEAARLELQQMLLEFQARYAAINASDIRGF